MPTVERKALKKERRRLRLLVETFRKIWGPGLEDMRFEGSPHSGDLIEDAELVLHELAHQTLMPKQLVFSPGRMGPSDAFGEVQLYIHRLRFPFLKDLHEIKAIAIEILASNQLDLDVDVYALMHAARMNTKIFKYRPEEELEYLVNKATRLPSVQFKADTIVYFVEKTIRSQP